MLKKVVGRGVTSLQMVGYFVKNVGACGENRGLNLLLGGREFVGDGGLLFFGMLPMSRLAHNVCW